VARKNFGFEKRQKEEARKKKKAEKLQRRRDAREQGRAEGEAPADPDGTPREGVGDSIPTADSTR
jgi:hypothetical protein